MAKTLRPRMSLRRTSNARNGQIKKLVLKRGGGTLGNSLVAQWVKNRCSHYYGTVQSLGGELLLAPGVAKKKEGRGKLDT